MAGEYYFTQVHEDAIIKYISSEDKRERDVIFEKILLPVFVEMIEKIVYTFKFTSLPNVDQLKQECLVYLTTILCKFKRDKGAAFAYFSVITKNYFIAATKKQIKRMKHEVSYEDIVGSDKDSINDDSIESYEDTRHRNEFWNFLIEKVKEWDSIPNLKDNERRVLDAVKHLLNNHDNFEIHNKRAIYLYIRDMTDLNTKQVVVALNSLRRKYREALKEWNQKI